ncbi:ATP-binding protein [Sphingomonas sp. AR_OL41]|uniref:sensor histidine kinase n=1 Tax=Sphingomonas sp. AR_OL41 TaxID=3042729 RepID=UPI00247FCF27|nr:ATP-binding protein [Sphingomonas sp. AR_OL41]MDH7975016.1 ATP-binding protein [Sphingomonas sp. AR_OL41]
MVATGGLISRKLTGLTLTLGPRELMVTALTFALSTTAAFVVHAAYGKVAGALVFVFCITVSGALAGLASALITAFGAFLIYNFYMVAPPLTLRIATGRELAPLIIFNLCAVVAGTLAGRLRDHADANRATNLQLATLLELSQSLQSAARLQDVIDTLITATYRLVGAQITLFRLDGGVLVPIGPTPMFDWHGLANAALFDDAPLVRSDMFTARRLDGSTDVLGVMILREFRPHRLQSSILIALGNVVALALERGMLSEEIAERRAADRVEELKTALLSSISHDFRTPLAAISASASSLIDYRDQLDAVTSADLLRTITDECARLNRYTANLLELSQLEAGGPTLRLQTLSVSDILGSAIQRARARAAGRSLVRKGDDADLLVSADPALFELVMVNVLDNAINYSGDGTEIRVVSERAGDQCRITVADQGCGIPKGDLDLVFGRFYRVNRAEASPRGSGLGLAIARGFVRALNGTIEAQTPGIGEVGTRITITLPLAAIAP